MPTCAVAPFSILLPTLPAAPCRASQQDRVAQHDRIRRGRRLRRMQALRADPSWQDELHAEALRDGGMSGTNWPGDVRELHDKIERQRIASFVQGGLYPNERPVTNKDRKLITDNLPRGIQVQRDDPRRLV